MMDSSLSSKNMALTMVRLRSKFKEQETFYCCSYAMGTDKGLPLITGTTPILPCSTLLPKVEPWKWS